MAGPPVIQTANAGQFTLPVGRHDKWQYLAEEEFARAYELLEAGLPVS